MDPVEPDAEPGDPGDEPGDPGDEPGEPGEESVSGASDTPAEGSAQGSEGGSAPDDARIPAVTDLTPRTSGGTEAVEPIFKPLIEQLKDEDPGIREFASWTLGQLRFKTAARPLAALLREDPEPSVRWAAAEAMGFIRDLDTVQSLIGALGDEDLVVRFRAAESLGKIGDRRAEEPLDRAMHRDENEPIRPFLIRVLSLITGRVWRYKSSTEKKIERYRNEVETDPFSATAHYNLAVAYFHNEQFDLALYHCEVAKKYEAGVKWLENKLSELPPQLLEPQGPRVRELRGEARPQVQPGEGYVEGELVYDSGPVDSQTDSDPDHDPDDDDGGN